MSCFCRNTVIFRTTKFQRSSACVKRISMSRKLIWITFHLAAYNGSHKPSIYIFTFIFISRTCDQLTTTSPLLSIIGFISIICLIKKRSERVYFQRAMICILIILISIIRIAKCYITRSNLYKRKDQSVLLIDYRSNL